jgi:hypothetical protein
LSITALFRSLSSFSSSLLFFSLLRLNRQSSHLLSMRVCISQQATNPENHALIHVKDGVINKKFIVSSSPFSFLSLLLSIFVCFFFLVSSPFSAGPRPTDSGCEEDAFVLTVLPRPAIVPQTVACRPHQAQRLL